MTALGAVLLYFVLLGGVLAAWSRGLPSAENSSRTLRRHLAKQDAHQRADGDCFPVPTPVHVSGDTE
jgi:hypothetical protein